MGELQCTLEFSIELHKFINVDLFQRGFYQVRSILKTSPKLPVKIEVNLPKNSSCTLVFPACIVNGTAVSKTFQILYKNEEVVLDDIIIFKVHALVEGDRVRETLLKSDFQIIVELWFTDQTFGPDQHNSIHCVSTRTLLLHFDPARGLHHHVPLLFDYFHLCAVTITIHASLIAICQPYLKKGMVASLHQTSIQKPPKQTFLTGSPRLSNKKSQSSLESVFFGLQGGRSVSPSSRMCRAHLVHWELVSILLSAYECLCRKLMEYMTLLPPWQQLKLDSIENSTSLENLSDFAKECHKHVKSGHIPTKEKLFGPYEGMCTEDDFLMKANSDIAQLCGALILLWQKFLEIVIGREKVRQHLSRQRHFQRVKRFSEAFFIIERTRDSALAPCDSSVEAYQEVSEDLRKSTYFNLLPPLEVECVEFDGDLNSLPIVYEEHYQEMARRGSGNSQSSQSDSTVSLTDVNFLVEESVDENSEANRRTSQGSLGQNYRSPDISATPTSPSAYSWCPETVSSPVSLKSSCLPSKKHYLKDKMLHMENDTEEYVVPSGPFSRINQKIAVRSKMKLRSRTVNFLRQLKKPQFCQSPNTVVLLGVKKLDTCHSVACGIAKSSRIPFAFEKGIRHSQSTLSVMSTLYPEGNSSIPNSESMPDLTGGFIPPPPPPPMLQKPQILNGTTQSTALPFESSEKIPSVPTCLISESGITGKTYSMSQKDMSNKTSPTDSESTIKSLTPKKTEEIAHENGLDSNKSSKANVRKYTHHEGLNQTSAKNMKKHSDVVVSHQPVKSNSKVNIEKKRGNKFDPPPPLSFNSSELTTLVETKASSNAYEVCPPSPPVQFRDPPTNLQSNVYNSNGEKPLKVKKKKHPIETASKANTSRSNTSRFNDSCLTSIICQGTLFFPKPPAQFVDDVSEAPEEADTTADDITSDKLDKIVESSNQSKEGDSNDTAESSEDTARKQLENTISFFDTKCTILEMLTDLSEQSEACANDGMSTTSVGERQRSYSLITANSTADDVPSVRRASVIGTEMISFVKAKEEFRKQLQYPWLWYSDFPNLASDIPYFQCDSDLRAFSLEGMHLVVCVHGLNGNSADLRLVKTYLELGLPTVNFEFLMSERNQGETFDDFDTMTDRLVSEISYYIEVYGLKPVKISFIGHSLGNIIIRSAVTRPEMKPYLSKLHTFLSLSGPHLGTLYNSSGLVNMGMWFMQKFKKSGSLLQLSMKDASDLRQTFLYKLSQKSGLEHFRNILLFGSSQDRYVPLHSARIELCKPALKDTSLQGVIYREMVNNIIQPIIQNPDVSLLRYDVHHALPSSANSLIGRAAHIAVLDSELFIEKFLAVCGLRFFT